MSEESLQESSERIVPGHEARSPADFASHEFHIATYLWAATLAQDRRVLDFGCGTGYGAAIVAESAAQVVAVDPFSAAIAYARQHFSARNITFDTIDGDLPVADGSQDVVLSFQVIEHVDPNPYLEEMTRVLHPAGIALFATPNRLTRLFGWQRPWNRWHRTEYSPDGLRALLLNHFDEVELLGFRDDGDLSRLLLARWRRSRLLTVPVTLPFIPDGFRKVGLRWLSHLAQARRVSAFTKPSGTVEIVPIDESDCEILAIARIPTRR